MDDIGCLRIEAARLKELRRQNEELLAHYDRLQRRRFARLRSIYLLIRACLGFERNIDHYLSYGPGEQIQVPRTNVVSRGSDIALNH